VFDMKRQMVMATVLAAGWLGVASAQQPADVPPSEPTAARSLVDKAQALQADDKWKEAVQNFEAAHRAEPTNEAVIFGLGTAYSQVGRYREGLDLLQDLLKRVPDHPSVQNNIAWIYAKATDPAIRDPAKALRYARRALMVTPSDPNIWSTLAEAYYAAGDYPRALRVARQAFQMARLSGETNLKAQKELLERCRTAAGQPPADA
jgi:tetratricopeptide (TPR) repeat protein